MALVGGLAVAATSVALWLGSGNQSDQGPRPDTSTPPAAADDDVRWNDDVDRLLRELNESLDRLDEDTQQLFEKK